ncbi:MAG: hypothetical protein Q8S01_14265 [Ignavibacteria bacterium]|nr:hypothetical protein [Ignavibacteria bacterium]
MDNLQTQKIIDWRWVGAGFCLLVIYHLLPSILISGFLVHGYLSLFGWMFIGIIILSFYFGYKSSGVTIIEPGIAAVLYSLLFIYSSKGMLYKTMDWNASPLLFYLLFFGVSFVFATLSAWFGERFQALKKEKELKQSTPA